MGERHAFWVIVTGTTPTAFRSRYREDLLPTLTQLLRTAPDAMLQWFDRGKLWASPEAARDALKAERQASRPRDRDRDWRPGGDHKDPRARYKLTRDQKRARFKKRRPDWKGPKPPAGSGDDWRPPPPRDDRRTDSRGPDDRRPDRRPDNRRPDNRRPDNRRPDNRRPDNRRPDGQRPENRTPGWKGNARGGWKGRPRPDSSRGDDRRGPRPPGAAAQGNRPAGRPQGNWRGRRDDRAKPHGDRRDFRGPSGRKPWQGRPPKRDGKGRPPPRKKGS